MGNVFMALFDLGTGIAGIVDQIKNENGKKLDRNLGAIEKNYNAIKDNNGLLRTIDGKVDRNYNAITNNLKAIMENGKGIQQVSYKVDKAVQFLGKGIDRNFMAINQGFQMVSSGLDRNLMAITQGFQLTFFGLVINMIGIIINYRAIKAVESKVDRNFVQMIYAFQETQKSIEAMKEMMKNQFDSLKEYLKKTKVEEVTSDLIIFIDDFVSKRNLAEELTKEELIVFLEGTNGSNGFISKIQNLDVLHESLFKIINYKFAMPENANDQVAFKTIDLLLIGTSAYLQCYFFLIYSYKYIANHYYGQKDLKKFNKYTSLVSFTIKNHDRILVGQNGSDGLIDAVYKIMTDVSSLDFIEQERKDLIELASKVKHLRDPFKNSLKNVTSLNAFIETKPTIKLEFDFSKTKIKTPIGKWKDYEEVRYAIQYRNGTELSQVSDWSSPYKIYGKACPHLKLKNSQIKGDRLIYRQISDNQPELVQIIKDEKVQVFRDISKDVFDVIFENENEELSMIELEHLLNDGTNVNDLFEDELPLIHHLSKRNKINFTRKIIEEYKLNVTAKDSDNRQAIHLATERGYERMTKLLIEYKADVNCKTKLNWTPFHYACKSGNEELVSYLIKKGANVSETTENEFNAFHISSLSDKSNMIKFLKENTSLDINSVSNEGLSPLHIAVMNENMSTVKTLLEYDDLVNVNVQTKEGKLTPLHLAVSIGNAEMVKFLLQSKKMNVNYLSTDGWSALHLSIFSEKEETTMQLLNMNDIDVNLKGKSNLTALHIAVMKNEAKIVKTLLNKDAQIEERENSGSTALHIAVDKNNFEIVKLLASKGAKINVRQNNGNTPLLLASSDKSKFKIVKYLVEKGARVDDENEIGNTPIDIASAKGNLITFNYLKENGASLKTAINLAVYGSQIEIINLLIKDDKEIAFRTDKNKNSILHYAALNANAPMIKHFIEQDKEKKEFNLNSKNSDGDTILNLCALTGSYECVRYLSSLKDIDLNTVNNENYTPILKAANSQNWAIVEYLSSNKQVNMHKTAKYNNHVLHFACRDNMKDMIDYLLDNLRIDVNILNDDKWSPLFFATRNGHINLVKYLVDEKNADYKLVDKNGLSILHLSILSGNLEMVKYFVEKKELRIDSRNNQTPYLHLAAKNNDIETIKYIVEKDSNINEIDKDGNTPILLAVKEKNWDTVKFLIEKDADIGILNDEKDSFLNLIAGDYKLDILELLKKKNVKLGRENRNKKGMNCVHISALNNQFEMTKWFIENDFVFEPDNLGNTPLHYSAKANDLRTTKYLAEKFDPHAVNNDKESPLTLTEDVKVAKFLIEEKKSTFEKDAFVIAKNFNNLGVLKYLIECEHHNQNAVDSEDKNILIHSAQNNQLNKVKYLVNDLKMDINKRDKLGRTATDYSVSNNHTSVGLYLDEMNNSKDIITFSSPHYRYDISKAIEKKNLKLVQYFIDVQKVDPFKWKGYHDKSLLHIAAIKGNLEIVKYLVDVKKMNATSTLDVYHNIAAHDSSFYGNLDITKYFVDEKKVPINAKTKTSETLLHKASLGNQIEVVKYLVGKGANIFATNSERRTSVHLAAVFGQLDIVRYFIEEKKMNIESKGYNDRSLLMEAAENNHFLLFYYLITKNANVDARGGFRWVFKDNSHKAIHHATDGGCIDCLKHLIEKSKVNIEEKAGNWETPLLLSCKNNKLKIFKYLLSKNANLDAREYSVYDYCVHLASKNGSLDVLKHLVENLHVDIERYNYKDCTALHRAAAFGQYSAVKYLVQKGANRKANKCFGNQTPLTLARKYKYPDIVDYLESFQTFQAPIKASSNDHLNHNSSLKIKEKLTKKMSNVKIEHLDFTSTLMLLNVLVRKYTKESFVPGVNEGLSVLDAKMIALNILDSFENVLKESLEKNNIDHEYLNYDPTAVIEDIVYHLRNGNGVDKISKLLISVIESNYEELANTEQIKDELIENLEGVLMRGLNITSLPEYDSNDLSNDLSNDYLVPMNSQVHLVDTFELDKLN